ncbi:sensor histidine kinase [Alkalimarinus alittae]|uniref:histidine kinase n=1 Tax=Alkalimarinus alittae TaxID=2961619 RepID=A0ABY6N0I1_9ALTE|nr:ATP-binding protein [Alkalimarinus alittae]UZE95596.1 ATP-binding protein [Alkalimarinus alittae]
MEHSAQSLRLFRFYNHYRIVVGLILVGAVFFNISFIDPAQQRSALYQITAICYLSINVFTAFILLAGFQANSKHIITAIIFDIIILHILMYASNGVQTGLGNLVVISVAAGNILIRGRIGTLFAALAALASLGIELNQVFNYDDKVDGVVRAGLLGIIYFAAAFLLQNISTRISQSEELAQVRAKNIVELEKLNHQIIQRMQTGIVVTDEFGNVRLLNQAALSLLNVDDERKLPAPLKQRQDLWRANPNIRTEPFQTSASGTMLQANFTQLKKDTGSGILIFIEDTSKISQQAQQMKLASLGRLTAGIAHEIRNPLGAISHAAQLLAESESLSSADSRMTDIIQRHSGRVNGIVESILQLSRRKQPEAIENNINEWLIKFFQDYTLSHSPTPEITLKLKEESPIARFDPSQIEQVVTNLVDNGLRYSEKVTGKPTLTVCSGINERNGLAFIDIIDQGHGVSEEDIEHLFEPFFTTESSGTGLGLYLSRELCESNQAQLNYYSNNQSTRYKTNQDTQNKDERKTSESEEHQGEQNSPDSRFRITFAHHKRII